MEIACGWKRLLGRCGLRENQPRGTRWILPATTLMIQTRVLGWESREHAIVITASNVGWFCDSGRRLQLVRRVGLAVFYSSVSNFPFWQKKQSSSIAIVARALQIRHKSIGRIDVRSSTSEGGQSGQVFEFVRSLITWRQIMSYSRITCALFVLPACALVVAVAIANPDCDGSNPTNGSCGTYTACQYQNPPTIGTPPTCVGNEIFQVGGSFACTTPPGTGSTLCGDVTVNPPIPCTTKKACTLFADTTLNPPRYWCAGHGTESTNSTTSSKKDNVACNDTTDG